MKLIIRKKREGSALTRAEIERWIRGALDGTIPDYQSAALLMAITIRGMDREETVALTETMLHSGSVLTWEGLGRPTVDKHSTGGVGDKVSIALAPWVAACGAVVPMIAGRGLGHTGGTLDKLEAIPGFRCCLGSAEFAAQVRKIGFAITGQSDDIAPADGKLYALRDVTATVESRPLIVASILSKKLAAGASGIVFDVKCGRGALMESQADATALARDLVDVTRLLGRKARALVTAMDQPLGFAIGNANETAEALAVLRGEGPRDLTELTQLLGSAMLILCGVARERHEAEARLERALTSGDALRRAELLIQTQGGDPRVATDAARLPRAPCEVRVLADREGWVTAIDGRALGELVIAMGGGRRVREDSVDPAVGIRLLRKEGDRVATGEALAVVEARHENPEWADLARRAYTITDKKPAAMPVLIADLGV